MDQETVNPAQENPSNGAPIPEADAEKVIIEDEQDAEIMKSFKEETPKEAEVEETAEPTIKSLASMDFYEALQQIVEGKKLHKLEWKNLGYYGMLDQSKLLVLHKPDGKNYQWTLSEADIQGTDYVVIN